MPDEITSPVTVAEAPASESAPQPVAAPVGQTPPAPAADVAPPAATEPDIDSLLTNPEYRQRLLSHPELEKEFNRHRSEGGRRAKAELEAYQQQVQTWYREQESKRVQTLEDEEAGQMYKKNLAEQERLAAQQAQIAQAHAEARRKAAEELYQIVMDTDLGEQEKLQLNPLNPAYTTLAEWQRAVVKAIGTKEAQKIAKDLIPKEVEARVQERLGADREAAPAVPTTPAGAPGQSASDFFKDFAGGKSNDVNRAKALLKEIGLTL